MKKQKRIVLFISVSIVVFLAGFSTGMVTHSKMSDNLASANKSSGKVEMIEQLTPINQNLGSVTPHEYVLSDNVSAFWSGVESPYKYTINFRDSELTDILIQLDDITYSTHVGMVTIDFPGEGKYLVRAFEKNPDDKGPLKGKLLLSVNLEIDKDGMITNMSTPEGSASKSITQKQ